MASKAWLLEVWADAWREDVLIKEPLLVRMGRAPSSDWDVGFRAPELVPASELLELGPAQHSPPQSAYDLYE